jgi:NOL1/NOP2/fmu family ribosome biogenesis protein
LAENTERHRPLAYLEARFGISAGLFREYLLFKRGKAWLLVKDNPHIIDASSLKVLRVGLRAFYDVGAFIKPSTRMIQLFGHAATRARLEIDQAQLRCLWAGESLSLDLNLEKGYVILYLERAMILGLGFYSDGRVRSQMPRVELGKAMAI